MKKIYNVEIDITYSVSVRIEAENEYDAKCLAEEKIGKDPQYWVRQGAIANINAYDVNEE